MSFAIGDLVRVLAPFTDAFPGVYAIESQREDAPTVWRIDGGRDIDQVFLEPAA